MTTNLYIKQKVFSIGERFTVTDEYGTVRYNVRGSFLDIPKTFRIRAGENDEHGPEVAVITKRIFSLLPHFSVDMDGREVAAIDKEFTLFKPRYRVDAAGLEIDGDWWNLNFDITRGGAPVARISQRLLAWGDTYEVTVFDERLEALIVSIVVAIDCVKADDARGGAATAS
ncbi:LURP-one-related family protein [Bifidobacterium amazonense]|uniref:LURP-one-related family protein n=1 Tax=Bifidobacterium amazonense TaxID=2809027 RepID=A0ABS9VWR8_9BIFI|nr:LURP-one-related family protein [Bifidobacterium amazonense]MCH9276548.1 LURP-one-related family protein [Bifidobacterium amazonense]